MSQVFSLNLCFWQCAGAKHKNKARSVQMLWHLRFCHTVAKNWGKVQNNLLSFVSIFLIRCKELIQTSNLLRAPPESLEKVGAPSDVPGFQPLFEKHFHLYYIFKSEREIETEKIYCTRMIKSYWDVKSAKFKSGHNQVQPAGQQVQLWCQPVGVTVLGKSVWEDWWKPSLENLQNIRYLKSSEKL